MTMKKRERAEKKVPVFADEQEAAAFWDTHSPLDFPDDFEEVELRISRPARKRSLTVDLDSAAIERLSAVAADQGTDPSSLARRWILEHLDSLPPQPASGPVR
jgi:hypothetical protein